jgi:hypothetical protein
MKNDFRVRLCQKQLIVVLGLGGSDSGELTPTPLSSTNRDIAKYEYAEISFLDKILSKTHAHYSRPNEGAVFG